MSISKKITVVLAVFIFMLFSLAVNADMHEDTVSSAVTVINKLENNFRKSVKTNGPVKLGLINGFNKNFCISFNTALHHFSQIEQLPVSFEKPQSVEVPVLLYHHVTKEPGYGDNVISAETFNKHLIAVKNAGYTTVSAKQLINYVYYGETLPEKPILITFDDGYLSNYELAYPILKNHDMKAVIFAIGWAIGKDEYKDTGKSIISHFTYEHINIMTESGLIEVQSHTFDMHQSEDYEAPETFREYATKLENETEDEYVSALENDYKRFDKLLFNYTGNRNYALAYPHGKYSELSEEVLNRLGAKITFSTEYSEKNILVQGNINSLSALNRFTISEGISPSQLITLIDSVYSESQEKEHE